MKIYEVKDAEYTKVISKFCDLEHGPWVAGGSVRKVFQGLPWKSQDIDFFFSSASQFYAFKNRIGELGQVSKNCYQTQNAITYTINTDPAAINESIYDVFENKETKFTLKNLNDIRAEDTWQKVQLINKRYYASAKDLIDSFDIGLAQFVTNGKVILASEQALTDCADNRIRLNPAHTKPTTPNRIIKYSAYGFNPDYELFRKTVKDILTGTVRLVDDNEY